jgi:hypothetical protein
MGFAPPPHDGFALLASATRMRLAAGTFPMLAMYAPYTESQSLAIPLGENCPHRAGAQGGRALHVVSHRRRTTSSTRAQRCVSEKAGFYLIKTCKQRGLLLGSLRETSRPQHPLMRSALFLLKCFLVAGVVVPLEGPV